MTGLARVVLGGLVFLTVWTALAQIVALAALGFDLLIVALVVAAAVGLWCATRRRSVEAVAQVFEDPGLRFRVPALRLDRGALPDRLTLGLAVLAGIAGLVAIALQYRFSAFEPLWIVGLATALLAMLRAPADGAAPLILGPRIAAPAFPAIWLTLGIAVVMGLFYAVVSIPDADDALFLNFATGAKVAREAVFATDTMLGIDGLDFIKSTYRLESYLLLVAVVSEVTTLPVLPVAHGLLPALLIAWSACALTMIHHALFGCHRVPTLLLHLVALAALDGSLLSYGYHALPRFFHGKAVFVTVVVPLIALATVAWLRQGRRAGLVLLGLAVITGVGFTANAVYAGPLTAALLGLLHLLTGGAVRWRFLALPAVVLWPGLVVAAVLLTDPPGGSEYADPGTVGGALWPLAGTPVAMLGLVCLLLSGAGAGLLHRSLVAVSLGVAVLLVVVLNPLLWDLYGALVTGNLNYRLMWAVPVPMILAVIAGLVWSAGGRALRSAVAVAALGALFWPGSILWQVPAWGAFPRVPGEAFALARAVDDVAGSEDLVLAPQPVATWIPVAEGAPAVVEARMTYVSQRRDPAHREVLVMRATLFEAWSRRDAPPLTPERLSALVSETGVTVVVVDDARQIHRAALPILQRLGFRKAAAADGHLILKR
ncbi:MAG: DUF6077 domain-containing protein [Pseudomonadota bacterium]